MLSGASPRSSSEDVAMSMLQATISEAADFAHRTRP
jgi:hypothetical protein